MKEPTIEERPRYLGYTPLTSDNKIWHKPSGKPGWYKLMRVYNDILHDEGETTEEVINLLEKTTEQEFIPDEQEGGMDL